MSYNNTVLSENRYRWLRLSPLKIIAILLSLVLVITVVIIYNYRAHLLWWYAQKYSGLKTFEAVPSSPMPEVSKPTDWVICHIDGLEFLLPPEIAQNKIGPRNGVDLYYNDTRSVAVRLDTMDAGTIAYLEAASTLCPKSEHFTRPKFLLACYQAKSNDFSWSMSKDELRWHAFCITNSSLLRVSSAGHVETLFRHDLDGIIHFHGNVAMFDWQCTNDSRGGSMLFKFKDKNLDPNWIRAVCQSIKMLDLVDKEDERSNH
jgi:hypothetical protein